MQKEKNYGWALDSARKNPYNSCVAHPGVAQLVARMVRDHEAVGSNPPLGPNNDNPNYIIQVGNVFGFIISIENVL